MEEDKWSQQQIFSATRIPAQKLEYSNDESYGFVPSSIVPTLHELALKTQRQIDVNCCRYGRKHFKIYFQ